jgi:hypothetical protein
VTGSFATKTEVGTASGNAVTKAVSSAKSYVDTNYATNTRVQNVEGDVATLKASAETLNNRFTSVYTYKGSVANFASLPETGKTQGYVYNVVAANGNIPAGTNYAWNGSAWDALGGTVDLSNYATTGNMSTFSAGVVTRFTTNESDIATLKTSAATLNNKFAGYVPTGRTVNGHALNANVTVTKGDVGLGNVENTALSTWTGNTSIKSVGTITAGTWHGSKIENAYLANTGITIDGTATALGGSVNTKNTQQENSTTANYRPLLMGTNNNAAQASIPTTTVTGTTYFNKEIYAQPSTGELGATKMKVGGHVTLQYNSATEALDFIFS